MPTYGYKCEKCGHQFEELQLMNAAPLEKCPECKGKVKRLIGGGSGVIFKGKGFYSTDYKKNSMVKDSPKKSGGCSGCPGTCKH
jgi:putative FmdB family regulatory protein